MSDDWKTHAVKLPKYGDERRVEAVVHKDEHLGLDNDVEYVAKYDVICDFTEVWTESRSRDFWKRTRLHTETIRPIPPKLTRWARIKNWLIQSKTSLPPARVV